MLTRKERLRDSVVDAQIHTVAHAADLRVSRFGMVTDERGHECGAVGPNYRLVRNADLIASVDLTCDKLGLDLEVERGLYGGGKSSYTFLLPETWKVPGDTSDLKSNITVGNGYGGTKNLWGTGGTYRMICTNGMSVGTIVSQMRQRHIGEFDVLELVEDMMLELIAQVTHEKRRAIEAAETVFEYNVVNATTEDDRLLRGQNHLLLTTIGKDTPKRYQKPLADAIKTLRHEVGHTAWAIVQAIGEIAEHDMHNSNAALEWRRRNQVRVLETVGV